MTSNTAQNATLHPHPAAALSSFRIVVGELCDEQDAALMQVIAMAKLVKAALDSDMDDAADNASHALDAIIKIATLASAKLDTAQIEISDARILDAAAREGAARSMSSFGHVTPH